MNPNILTEQLGLFLDVLEAGSFSAAARRHPLTPSAVARRIDSLESAVGTTLFMRTTHAVVARRPAWPLLNGHGVSSPNCSWPAPKRCP